ncbi:hypothetical protein [Nannocystis radixulma]|uniref:Uncharacterized protein n=1 Tax=Nannocystis radixulma TaxID=2995305 RepID=A0ABT5B6R7_9BACT|nr:hypothetical protein [Nannocystis radixulma]MDC0669815.1 hypothetical protein [Nannocystis radixulma]
MGARRGAVIGRRIRRGRLAADAGAHSALEGIQPTEPVGTISVRALLVAPADLPEDLVFAVTESLFSPKVELSTQEQLLSHLTESFDLAAPALHQREQPGDHDRRAAVAAPIISTRAGSPRSARAPTSRPCARSWSRPASGLWASWPTRTRAVILQDYPSSRIAEVDRLLAANPGRSASP